jgi:hypothetical protein
MLNVEYGVRTRLGSNCSLLREHIAYISSHAL